MTSVKMHIQQLPYWGHFKVFKAKSGYLCGVCRKTYPGEEQALSCVKGCSSHKGHNQIDVLVRGLKTRYRCGYCYREYGENSLASQCLTRCQTIVVNRLNGVKQLVNVSPVMPVLDAATVSPSSGLSEKENVAKFLQHVEEQPQHMNIVVGDGDPNIIYREMNQKAFSRHNANYVCSACKNKFFTKAEVEACFESHPIRDPLIK